MRFIVELRPTDHGVEGEITAEGATEPQQFSSWIELLQILEPSATRGSEKPEQTEPPGGGTSAEGDR